MRRVVVLVVACTALNVVADQPPRGKDVDKCAGCTSMVDRMYQAVLKAAPGETRQETSIVEIFDGFCDQFQWYNSMTFYNKTLDQEFVYYRPPTEPTTEATADGGRLMHFCQALYESHEEMLEEYALSLTKKSSSNIQVDLCVKKMDHCTEKYLKDMAITFVGALRAANMDPRKLKSTTRENPDGKKSKRKKKKKKKSKKKSKKEL